MWGWRYQATASAWRRIRGSKLAAIRKHKPIFPIYTVAGASHPTNSVLSK
jgi:hypothetical protein